MNKTSLKECNDLICICAVFVLYLFVMRMCGIYVWHGCGASVLL